MTEGEILKDIRHKMQLTQPELVEKVGPPLSQALLSQAENNKRSLSEDTLCRVAETCGVDALPLLMARSQNGCLHRTALAILNIPADSQAKATDTLMAEVDTLVQKLKEQATECESQSSATRSMASTQIKVTARHLIDNIQAITLLSTHNHTK